MTINPARKRSTRAARLAAAAFVAGALVVPIQLMSPAAAAVGTTYYVDADGGNDSAAGTSPGTALRSLRAASQLDLGPGDKILFERGDEWVGQLLLDGVAGTANDPIVVGAYGDGGRRPVIHGDSPDHTVSYATVEVRNADHVHVTGLELTNMSKQREVEGGGGGLRQGINFVVDDATKTLYEGLRVSDVFIHDVDGKTDPAGDSNDGKRTGGIGFHIDDDHDGAAVRFADISVTDSRIERVDQSGLWLESRFRNKALMPGGEGTTPAGHTWDEMKWTGVDIGYNDFVDIGKNAAILRMMDGGSFHHNYVSQNADRVLHGNTVFTSYVDGAVIEWNQVGNNLAHSTKDGAAFDADLDSPNTVWRYNYSHDNNYGLLTMCTRDRDGGILIHNNIEIGGRGRTININYSFEDLSVTDNAFWAKPVADVEYPDTYPDYVNQDRAQAEGYPQLMWETYLRTEGEFIHGQKYTYTGNTIYNEAPTATFYLNPNDPEVSQQFVERTVADNTFYGIWPADGSGEAVESGFTNGGATPPANWIADTVGQDVHDFWASAIAGEDNPDIGPRGESFPELDERPDVPEVDDPTLLALADTVIWSLTEAGGNTHFTSNARKAAEWGATDRWDDPVQEFKAAPEGFTGMLPVKQYKKGDLYRYAMTDEQGAAARADGFSYNSNVFYAFPNAIRGTVPVHLIGNGAAYSMVVAGKLPDAAADGWQDLGVLFHAAPLAPLDLTAPTVTVKTGPGETIGSAAEGYEKVSFKLYDAGKVAGLSLNGVEKDLVDNEWSDLNGVVPGAFGAVLGENILQVRDVAGNVTTVTFTLVEPAPAHPAWSPTQVYTGGETVSHDGRTYVAQWWTRGDQPGSSNTGSWMEQGAVVSTPAGEATVWTPSWVYKGGETVAHDGHLWKAKWWTRNQEPGNPYGPWQDLGAY